MKTEIEIGCIPGKPNEVVVFVRDNGVGFDMRCSGKRFVVFQRLHRAEDFEGTGIGLATVMLGSFRASVVLSIDAHGGRLWTEPKRPRGVAFHFTLPAAKSRLR